MLQWDEIYLSYAPHSKKSMGHCHESPTLIILPNVPICVFYVLLRVSDVITSFIFLEYFMSLTASAPLTPEKEVGLLSYHGGSQEPVATWLSHAVFSQFLFPVKSCHYEKNFVWWTDGQFRYCWIIMWIHSFHSVLRFLPWHHFWGCIYLKFIRFSWFAVFHQHYCAILLSYF